MQYNNIANMRVPQNVRKNPMSASQFFPQTKQIFSDLQYSNKKQGAMKDKMQIKQSQNVPSFLQAKKTENISQSLIFNALYNKSQSAFQNPFILDKYARGSYQQPTKVKQGVPSFLKSDGKSSKQDSIGKVGFYKKFKSPEPLREKQSLFASGSIIKDSAMNRPRVGSKADSSNQGFSPVHPQRRFQYLTQKSNYDLLNKKMVEKQKQKNNRKQDEKSTMSISQKSTKIPQFIKKGSPQNNNNKQLQSQQLNKSERLFTIQKTIQKVSTQPCTQSEQSKQRKIDYVEGKVHGVTNYVQIQNNFSKNKPNDFTSASFAKVSNTPQSNPVKLQFLNTQYGRLSSPSSLNNRRRIDSTNTVKNFTVDDFQLVDKIGKGAFGDVYTAREKVTGFLCVLKKVSKKKIKQLKLQQNILRQIKIQSFLKHKHLTSLYGFFADQQYLYLILQILPDGSMNQVKKKKRVPQIQVSKYIRQVCEGLRYMHKEQIIHRDLKPQNIFLNQDYLKIGDFGCAIYTQTLRKTIVGCLAYISPEQLNNQFYDDKIDVWSIGILTYELITGKSPFQEDIVKISQQQIQAKFSKLTFPQDLQISQCCKDFITKLLELNPQDRMTIDQTMKHAFISKGIEQERKEQQQIFGQYQSI